MILRDINFGYVWDASGVRNFFGEGYPFHRTFKPFGLNFDGSTFVAKTTTLAPREGNMPLGRDGTTPKSLKPDCIVVKFTQGAVLNAVGLSGPGAEALFLDGRWQKRKKPFFLSFAAVGKTRAERMDEVNGFMRLCERHLPDFRAKVGIQLNLSCPNDGRTAETDEDFRSEAVLSLSHLGRLGVPLVPKLSVLTKVETAARIAEHPSCDAVTVSNAIPWHAIPLEIRASIFGGPVSPLATYGGGGLSGAPIHQLVLDWLYAANRLRFPKPIAAGGGILKTVDGQRFFHAGSDAVVIGSIAILRPWRVWHTVKTLGFYRRLSK